MTWFPPSKLGGWACFGGTGWADEPIFVRTAGDAEATTGACLRRCRVTHPSALHVRWRRPDGVTVGALAVDDEPTVFWDGGDAASRIERWQQMVGWTERWGSVTAGGGNGSSGRHVVGHVLRPLGVEAEQTYFTDCLPTYFIKSGNNTQATAIRDRYEPFAVAQRPRLPQADLPGRPSTTELVRLAVAEEGPTLRAQIAEAAAPIIVTLGQEAADVLARIAGVEHVPLTPGSTTAGRT
jgi:hypothetical protein